MSITVNTNMQALRIQSNLSSATDKMNTAMERMSSGSKINSAKDDAAGLAVSTTLSKTISSSKVASDNVKMGQDLLSTAEGTLDVVMENVVRVRSLVEQAANGTYSSSDKTAIAAEVKARVAQMYSLSNSATFNGKALFSGATGTAISIQSGTTATSQTSLSGTIFGSATPIFNGLFKSTVTGGAGNLQIQNSAGTYITVYKTAGGGAYTYDDTATEAAQIASVNTLITDLFAGTVYTDAAGTTTLYSLSNFLNDTDSAVSNITTRQTLIGAAQNQLQAVADGLEVEQTNLTSALSTIKDADVAEESAAYVQSQILQQASASLLVQANSAPQIALTLIKG